MEEASRRLSRLHLPHRPSRIPFARGGQRRLSAQSRQRFTVTGNPNVTTCCRSIDRIRRFPRDGGKSALAVRKRRGTSSAREGRAIGTRDYMRSRETRCDRESCRCGDEGAFRGRDCSIMSSFVRLARGERDSVIIHGTPSQGFLLPLASRECEFFPFLRRPSPPYVPIISLVIIA